MGKKNKKDSNAEKIERTGERTFNVHHDDGSVFECQANTPQAINALKNKKELGGQSKLFFFGGVGERKPLTCGKCKERVTRVSSKKEGILVCNNCQS